jgi:hypothetical protein
MRIRLAGIGIFGLLGLLLPVHAAAQNAASAPVAINACGPMINNNNTQTLFGVPVAQSSSGIKIQFTNESAKTANLINFSVDSNGDSFVIRDVGTFSPGVEITHRYSNGAGQAYVLPQFISPKIDCHVQSVSFTDGTTWRRGETALSSPLPASSNPLSVTPKAVALDSNAEPHLFMVLSNAKIAAFTERDTCQGIAAISLTSSGEAAATYMVKPLAAGTCSAAIRDEAGNSIMLPVTVR